MLYADVNTISVGAVVSSQLVVDLKISMTRFDDWLSQFRKKGVIRYRPIVREVFFAKIGLIEKRNDNRGFELISKDASRARKVNNFSQSR